MLASPQFSRSKGFTLLELLVSVAVLALLLVLVTQMLNGASAVINRSGKHMDADTESRLLFNRMAGDIARAVKRTDLDYSAFKQPAGTLGRQYNSASIPANLQTVNDQMAFYSETDGYFSGAKAPSGVEKSPVALVAYMVANDPYSGLPGLRRLGKGLGWEPDTAANWGCIAYLPMTLLGQWPKLFGDDPDYKTVGSQVFRIEYTYLLKATATQPARLSVTPWDTTATPPHTCINGFKDVAAIVVAIAVLDTTSQVLVKDYSSLTALFPDAVDSISDTTYKGDIAAAWKAVVNSPTFAASAQIPPIAAANVRIYERYFYLDTPRPP
ncbi:MAG: prepilin-type N-terminal cleavage/methylation domain-containing protein [Verrucomicrobiota bacterium]